MGLAVVFSTATRKLNHYFIHEKLQDGIYSGVIPNLDLQTINAAEKPFSVK